MGREAGHTQGFGRVSPVNRPSPYSPLHFKSTLTPPSASSTTRQPPKQRRILGRRIALGIAFAAAVFAGLGYIGLLRQPSTASRTASTPPTPTVSNAGKLDEQAKRLPRPAVTASPPR